MYFVAKLLVFNRLARIYSYIKPVLMFRGVTELYILEVREITRFGTQL